MPSTVIHHFVYDAETSVLTVRFVSGAVYEYKEVPAKVYERVKFAASKGKFFNKYIKDRFPFIRVN